MVERFCDLYFTIRLQIQKIKKKSLLCSFCFPISQVCSSPNTKLIFFLFVSSFVLLPMFLKFKMLYKYSCSLTFISRPFLAFSKFHFVNQFFHISLIRFLKFANRYFLRICMIFPHFFFLLFVFCRTTIHCTFMNDVIISL